MTPPASSSSRLEPRFPVLIALGVFIIAALMLMYPMLSGQFLAGSDQVNAGFAFRAFEAQSLHATGHIPLWNPFIFGGMPLWAVPGHFDVFYPTAWLRWIFSAGVVLTWSFFIHMIVAGLAMYSLLRALRSSWAAALVGGLAYELSGILASQVSPGHDGKLYAAALAPFAVMALIRAIRDGRTDFFGWFSLVIGLEMLTPHYQVAYYVLITCGLLTLWLCFLDPERDRRRSPWLSLGMATVAVIVGVGIAMVEVLPVLHMVQFTPRGAGGDSGGYAYATSWAMAPQETMTAILPQFNGMLDHYWGPNAVKDHTEYVGAIVVALMIFGLVAARRRRILVPFAIIGGLFLLVAWGDGTPFYHLWYHLPRMSQFRAPGIAFVMVALVACVFAGLGVDDVLEGLVPRRLVYSVFGVLGFIALLAAAGALQGVTEGLAIPGRERFVVANAPELQSGGVRLLVFVLLGGAAVIAVQRRVLQRGVAVAALVVVVAADNWSILRNFPQWLPPAPISYADDALTTAMKKTPMPFRSYTPEAPDAEPQLRAQAGALQVWSGSALMARGVPTLLGYHGMESRYFDALLGGKNVWIYQFSSNIWDLFGVKYVALTQDENLPGYHKVMGPTELDDIAPAAKPQGVLYERDSAARWVRVVPAAVKVPEEQIPPTVANARFPIDSWVLLPDSSKAAAEPASATTPAASGVSATLENWTPGAMTVKLDGSDTRTTYLLIAENWYPDWHATVDGKPVEALRGDGALLTVPLAPGAKSVTLTYQIATYGTGKVISLLCLLLTIATLFAGRALSSRQVVDA